MSAQQMTLADAVDAPGYYSVHIKSANHMRYSAFTRWYPSRAEALAAGGWPSGPACRITARLVLPGADRGPWSELPQAARTAAMNTSREAHSA
jgi:hypothetical protein